MQKKSAVLINALWWNIFFIMTRCEGKFFLFTANLCGNEISVTAYHYCWDIRLLNGTFQQLVARYTWKQFLHKNQRAVRVLNGFLNSKLENKLLLNPSKWKRCCVARRCCVTRYTPLVELKLRAPLSNLVISSSCLVSSLIHPSVWIVT